MLFSRVACLGFCSCANMRPPTKRVDYKVGDKVEVCSKDDGLVGSYYEGTIVSCHDEREKYTVRYKNLLKDDESKLLT